MAIYVSTDTEWPPGKNLAVLAESLFLVNLLLLPGFGFLAILWLWLKYKLTAPTLATSHLRQVFYTSLRGGILLATAGVTFFAPWINDGTKWVVLIIYFTCIHSVLVCFGIVGLSRAMVGKDFRYPLFGPRNS
jgi:hypothetical protein